MTKQSRKFESSKFGEQIRRLRLTKHMSLGDLAAIVNTSRSFLSQVEQGKTLPSLGTLKLIASALGVTVGSLIDEPLEESHEPVVRKGKRARLDQLQAGIIIESLTHRDIHKSMQPLWVRMEPGASSGRETYVHQGQEFGFVAKGTLQVEVDGVQYTVHEGDSIYFDSSRPHRFSNGGEEEMITIWVITPPTF